MGEHFIFVVDAEYISNGCDCCEPLEWDNYICTSHNLNGSFSYESDALLGIVEYFNYEDYKTLLDEDSHQEDVEAYLISKGITWEIDYGDDIDDWADNQ